MGKLIYGFDGHSIEIDDRTLIHLQAVMTAKLRRDEKFVFTYECAPEHGSGREAIWVDPHIPLRFSYTGGKAPSMNRAWIDALLITANSPGGLRIVAEPSPT